MYLSCLKLWNFRKYGKADWDLEKPHLFVNFHEGLNVLIGENDSGKTAILDAIKFVLKTHAIEWIKINNEDFYSGSDKLRIEIIFGGLAPNEAKNFTEWLGWEGEGETAKPILRLIYQVEQKDGRVLPADVNAGMDEIGYPLNAIAKEYLQTTYLKALRDADTELTARKNSRVSQILQGHELFKEQKGIEHQFVAWFRGVNDSIQKWFEDSKQESDEQSHKEQIKDIIDHFLCEFIADGCSSRLTLTDPEIKAILEKISIRIENGMNFGLGTMNRLYMATELLHLKREWDGLKLCLIEELEVHIHPQAQMKVIEAIRKEKEVQFILTTHSPNIASKVKLSDLILCKDNDTYPLGEKYEGHDKKQENDHYTQLSPQDYVYLERFLDVTKSNLFFSKGVIIVEGWAEELLIPAIARKLECDLTRHEVSIVNVGSTAYLHFANIFLRNDEKKLRVYVSIVTDLDLREYERDRKRDAGGKDIKQGNRYVYEYTKQSHDCQNKKTEKEKSIIEENDFVKPFVSNLWTLEYCLLKSELVSEKFKKVLQEVHPDVFSETVKTEEDWEKSLAQILLSQSIQKTEIAHKLAIEINDIDFTQYQSNDTTSYLIEAIRHACTVNR